MQLNRNYYLLHDTIGEIVTHYDDVYILTGRLMGKKTSHLIVFVIKGDRAKLLPIDNDVMTFQKTLVETMRSL